MRNLIIFVTLVTFASVCLGLKDCGSSIGELVKFNGTGCKNGRCHFRRNSNITITVVFNTKQNVEKISSHVYGICQLHVSNDGCKDSGLSCPLKTGGPYNFTVTFPIGKNYRQMITYFNWELKDEVDNFILCLEIPVKVM